MFDCPIFSSLEEACAAVDIEPREVRRDFTQTNTIGRGKRGRGAGRIHLFADGKGGMCFNWQSGRRALFFFDYGGRKPTRAELRRMRKEAREQRDAYERELVQRQKAVAALAEQIICAATAQADGHAYLKRKRLSPGGLRCISGATAQALISQAAISHEDGCGQVLCNQGRYLVVPLIDATGAAWSVQLIGESGRKTFLKGGRKKGLFWCPDSVDAASGGVLGIAEGVATAMSVTKLYGVPCVAAIDAGNLAPAAEALRERFPNRALAFYADRDASGVGEEKAREAALMLQGRGAHCSVLLPPFTPEVDAEFVERTGQKPTDFNDFWIVWRDRDE